MARKRKDDAPAQILEVIRQYYIPNRPSAKADAYRYNSASIRVRVIDPGFARTDMTERDEEIWDVLQAHLSDDVLSQISLLLLLTPGETKSSLMNQEFENPAPSRL